MIFRGLGFSGKNYLMDLYGTATAGYSLRRLRRNYRGPAITVRRSSDNAIKHIYFKGENLDTQELLNFVGTSGTDNGFVAVWYDQSPNGNNASQITEAKQPKIVSAGALVTENGKVALDFDGANHFLAAPNFNSYSSTESFAFAVFSPKDFDQIRRIVDHDSFLIQSYSTAPVYNGAFVYEIGSYKGSGIASNLSQVQQLMSGGYDGSGILTYINGSLRGSNAIVGSISATSDPFEISSSGPTVGYSGTMQEIIIYNSDKSALRTQIETNINGHYNIYTP